MRYILCLGLFIGLFSGCFKKKSEVEKQNNQNSQTQTQAQRGNSAAHHPPYRGATPQKTGKKVEKGTFKDVVRWETLQGLDLQTGKPTPDIKDAMGIKRRIPGFVVPLDLNQQVSKEFILVPTYGACLHTPPPPANQMIHVTMKEGNAPLRENGPVWVLGVISITKTDTPWGKAGYKITADKTEPYQGGY
ncbi:MAG: DUF3299 domain-containing protein [Pseudobacteriovorax sp.]|nr:DUF3299 domain-containing protein [Pseudobacteriovorax sp.]